MNETKNPTTENEEYGCTAVILTAVEIETSSVKKRFPGWKLKKVPEDDQRYYETYYETPHGTAHLITAQQSVMGMTAAATLATKCIHQFRPRYLIMCGIAAGVGEEGHQLYGDVIVPDLVWDYSTGKFVGHDESEIRFGDVGFLPRPVSLRTDEDLLDVVRGTVGAADNEFHVHLGPLACGSSVVANSEVVEKRVLNLFPRTVGLDMESYSILYAAANCAGKKPKALVVKSICDFANSEKDDRFQRFAAYTSSGYVRYLLDGKLPL